ncbi:hypothetical protein [Butyrivibrio sp. LB2008]|nr:hypothetical protein [Butyrivibrio sp. LB2008]
MVIGDPYVIAVIFENVNEWVVEREALNKIANRLKNLTEADMDFFE